MLPRPLPNSPGEHETKFRRTRMSVGHRKRSNRSFAEKNRQKRIAVRAPVIDDNGPDRFVRIARCTPRVNPAHSRIVGIDRITSAQLIFFPRNRLSAHIPQPARACPLSSPNALVWPGAPRCNVAMHLEREPGTGRKRPRRCFRRVSIEIYSRFVRFTWKPAELSTYLFFINESQP